MVYHILSLGNNQAQDNSNGDWTELERVGLELMSGPGLEGIIQS